MTLSRQDTTNLRDLIRLLTTAADGYGLSLDSLSKTQEAQVVELAWNLQRAVEA